MSSIVYQIWHVWSLVDDQPTLFLNHRKAADQLAKKIKKTFPNLETTNIKALLKLLETYDGRETLMHGTVPIIQRHELKE